MAWKLHEIFVTLVKHFCKVARIYYDFLNKYLGITLLPKLKDFFWCTDHIAPLEEYCHTSNNTTFQERGKTKF
jgi:hypothetical protein